jgi:NADPH2:quinone reductase
VVTAPAATVDFDIRPSPTVARVSTANATETMQVVRARAFGAPDVLAVETTASPRPGSGEVLIEVLAVPVLHLDVQIRSGWETSLFGIEAPYIPGAGYVGRVVEVGPDTGHDLRGRVVAVDTGQTGGYVERSVADAARLITVPDGFEAVAAAALLHDGRTALGLLETVPVRRGDRVLVLGAAGGLGDLLLQLALARGAVVVAAARGEAKLQAARERGASAAIDYSTPSWRADAAAEVGDPGRFDVIFDGVGGDLGTASFELLAPGGHFSAHGAPSGAFASIDKKAAAQHSAVVTGIEAAQFDPDGVARLTAQAFAAAQRGEIRPNLSPTYTLTDAARAHTDIEARATYGKTVLITAAGRAHGLAVSA